jgi:hypothetical protein
MGVKSNIRILLADNLLKNPENKKRKEKRKKKKKD